MEFDIIVRELYQEDYSFCADIYQEGLDTGIATFETQVPDWKTWDAKFLKQCRYVATLNNEIVGWIALSPFSHREVYRGVAEVTLYIARSSQRKGIGIALLQYIINESQKREFWTLQAKIFAQNTKSLSLFSKCGFRQVGVRKKIAMRDGLWHDNVLMELRM